MFWACLFPALAFAQGEPNCRTDLDCDNISAEIVLWHANVSTMSVTNEPDPVKLDITGDGAYLEIEFNTEGCINGVTPMMIEMIPEEPYEDCPPVLAPIPSPFVLCQPQIFGKLATETGSGLADATVELSAVGTSCSPAPCGDDTETSSGAPDAGNYSFCPCLPCTEFVVEPMKDGDDLNGVSTFDLVLINKHILGIEPLGSPYKMIAANANNLGGITTTDIVEIRKLILGIITEFSNNTSWRFVDADYDFPNPANPFAAIFPETKTVDMVSNPNQEANFVAVKVGDVNGNAQANARALPATTIAVPGQGALAAGQVINVPVVYTGSGPLEAFQLGLRFDASKLELLGPSQGELPRYNAGNFGLTRAAEGEIRSLWFADPTVPDEALRPGDALFYLSFRVKKPLPPAAALLDADDGVLANIAWSAEGKAFSICRGQLLEDRAAPTSPPVAGLWAECLPNPAGDEARLIVRSDHATKARLAIFGPFGQRHWMQEATLAEGEQSFELPIAQLPAGVYFWKVLTPRAKVQGHLIKVD